jgi:multicomponent Na+:H+ antiporter subunit C
VETSQAFGNYPYFISVILFCLGCLCILTQHNLIKKVIGINIMETGIFLFYVAVGNIRGGVAPIYDPNLPEGILYINPLPSALMLTGIVVSFSVTAFALAIIVKLYNFYGTVYAPDIMRMR